MDKTIGYQEIAVSGGSLPLKFGLLAIEKYCNAVGVGFDEVVQKTLEQIKTNPITTYAQILKAGADCYQTIEGEGKEYPIKDAYRWVDEIGIYSSVMGDVFQEFLTALLPPKSEDLDQHVPKEAAKPKKKTVSRLKK